MSYAGDTHQIPCNVGGIVASENEEIIQPTSMVDGTKNLNIHKGGRQKRGGTAYASASGAIGTPEINGVFDFDQSSGSAYVIMTTDTGLIYSDPDTQIYTGWNNDKYTSMEQFDDNLYICNGNGIPQVWDGTGTTTDIGAGGISVPGAPTVAASGTGSGILLDTGVVYTWKVTFVNAHGETSGGTTSAEITPGATDDQIGLTEIPVGPSGVTSRKIYRTEGGGATYKLLTTLSDNTTTTYTDNTADAGLGAEIPASNTASSLPTDWTVTNYPQQCIKHGRGNSQRMWYIGCPSTPYTVYVSPNNLPEDLDDGSIATFKIDTGDRWGLVGGVVMNDKLFVFGKRSAYVMDDADTNTNNWGYVEAPWKAGVAHWRLIVRTPNDVICMDDTGEIYSVNAAQQYGDFEQASITRPSFMHQWIEDNVRLSYINNFHAIYDPNLRAIKFFVVRTGQTTVDTALVYFVDRGPVDGWMIHDNQTNQAGDRTNDTGYDAVSSALVRVGAGQYEVYTGGYAGRVWKLEQSAKADNSLRYYAGFKTPLSGLTEVRSDKNFKRGHLIINPQGTEKISIIPTIESKKGTVTLKKDIVTAESGVKNYKFNIGNNGRRISYEIYNDTVNEDFFISVIQTDVRPLGKDPE